MTTSCCTSFCQCRTAAQAGFDRVVLSASELAGAGPEQLQALEDNLGISIPDEVLGELKTVGDIVRYLEAAEQ